MGKKLFPSHFSHGQVDAADFLGSIGSGRRHGLGKTALHFKIPRFAQKLKRISQNNVCRILRRLDPGLLLTPEANVNRKQT
jgi:hypothetical protein